MTAWHRKDGRKWWVAAIGVAGVGLVRVMLLAEDEVWPLRDVVVPLDLYKNGEVRTEISAAGARLPTNGVSEAKGVRLSFYAPGGARDGVVTAERCRYDRAARTVTSEDRVRMEKGNLVVAGKGFAWRAEESKVWLKSDVKVEFIGVPLMSMVGPRGRAKATGSGFGR